MEIDVETNMTENKKQSNLLKPDSVKIRGIVEIKNGDKIIHAENRFVQSMLVWLTNFCSINYAYPTSNSKNKYISTSAWDIYCGTDTNTSTLYNTTVLTSPIGTSPGTPANSKSGGTTNPANGIFNVTYSATWPAGSISGTVGEIGLYLSVLGTLQPFGWVYQINNTSEPKVLVSRLSVTDTGGFSQFTIDTQFPLVISWTIQFMS